ncbi:MAG: hypothetical protein QM757_39115 [Paludibaculum sp.]
MGVRWELYPPATPNEKGGFSNYDPSNNTLWSLPASATTPSNLGMNNHKDYFAPRVGFAYRASDKTVIRGGSGISYTPFQDNTYAYNYPVRANNSFNPAVASYGPAILPDGSVATFQKGFPAPIQVPIPDSRHHHDP